MVESAVEGSEGGVSARGAVLGTQEGYTIMRGCTVTRAAR